MPPGCSLHYFLLDLINPQCPCEIARGGKCIYSTLRLMGRLRRVKHLLIVSGSSQFRATQWKAVPKRLESFNLSPCCINHTNSLNPFLGDSAFCSQSALYFPGLLECPCSPSPQPEPQKPGPKLFQVSPDLKPSIPLSPMYARLLDHMFQYSFGKGEKKRLSFRCKKAQKNSLLTSKYQ